jgi:hypothetical protein
VIGEKKNGHMEIYYINSIMRLGIYLENIISFGREDHDTLIEMMMLHGGCGVEDGKGGRCQLLESIVRSTMIQVMTQTGDHQTENLPTFFSIPI